MKKKKLLKKIKIAKKMLALCGITTDNAEAQIKGNTKTKELVEQGKNLDAADDMRDFFLEQLKKLNDKLKKKKK